MELTRARDRLQRGIPRSWLNGLDFMSCPTRGGGSLLRYRDGHGITDDLDQLSIRIRLTNQDSGVAAPAQGESRSVVKNSVRISRALDVEVHVTLERRSDFPVQDEPQLKSNVIRRQISAERRNQFTLSQKPTEGEGSLGALDSVSNILITSWIV